MKKYRKLAIFGGTFSPVHNGHLAALGAYANRVKPDVIYIIPTSISPSKQPFDGFMNKHRVEMLRLAICDTELDCEVVISDIEIQRGGKSYTIDTVNELLEIAQEVTLYCGTDMLMCLDKWYKHDELLKKVSVAYMHRKGDKLSCDAIKEKVKELKTEYGTEFFELPPALPNISSSEIRGIIASGGSIEKLLPKAVANYIKKYNLYLNVEGKQE